MSSSLALARERLKTIAETISELDGECALLPTIDAANLECWKRYTPGDFFFLAVCGSTLAYAGIEAPTSIHAYLYVHDDDGTAAALDDLVAQIKALWTDAANFAGGELICAAVTFDPYEALIEEEPGALLRAHLICYFPEV
jgi:hypothetical protein